MLPVTVGSYRFFYGMPLVRATAAQPNREANDEQRRDQEIFNVYAQNFIPSGSLKIKRIDDRQVLEMVWKVIAQLSINNIAAVATSISGISLGGILAALSSIRERARKMLILLALLFQISDEDEEENTVRKWRIFPRSHRRILPKRRCAK